jgi:hypothetical protein
VTQHAQHSLSSKQGTLPYVDNFGARFKISNACHFLYKIELFQLAGLHCFRTRFVLVSSCSHSRQMKLIKIKVRHQIINRIASQMIAVTESTVCSECCVVGQMDD